MKDRDFEQRMEEHQTKPQLNMETQINKLPTLYTQLEEANKKTEFLQKEIRLAEIEKYQYLIGKCFQLGINHYIQINKVLNAYQQGKHREAAVSGFGFTYSSSYAWLQLRDYKQIINFDQNDVPDQKEVSPEEFNYQLRLFIERIEPNDEVK